MMGAFLDWLNGVKAEPTACHACMLKDREIFGLKNQVEALQADKERRITALNLCEAEVTRLLAEAKRALVLGPAASDSSIHPIPLKAGVPAKVILKRKPPLVRKKPW